MPLVKRGPDLRRRIRGFPRAAAYAIIGRDLYGSHPSPGNDPSSDRGPILPRLSHATRVEDHWLGWTRFSGLLPDENYTGRKILGEKRSFLKVSRLPGFLLSLLFSLDSGKVTRYTCPGNFFLSRIYSDNR